MKFTSSSLSKLVLAGSLVFASCLSTVLRAAEDDQQHKIKTVVDRAVQPVMLNYSIGGMAVGLTISGKQYLFNYGVASRATKKPVTNDTLFELGSITKTFTATLATYAQGAGYLSLADKTSKYLPSLEKSKFGDVTLLNLGTHTSGGFSVASPREYTERGRADEVLGGLAATIYTRNL